MSYLKKLCKAEYAYDDDKDMEGTSVSHGGAARVPRKRRTGAGAKSEGSNGAEEHAAFMVAETERVLNVDSGATSSISYMCCDRAFFDELKSRTEIPIP